MMSSTVIDAKSALRSFQLLLLLLSTLCNLAHAIPSTSATISSTPLPSDANDQMPDSQSDDSHALNTFSLFTVTLLSLLAGFALLVLVVVIRKVWSRPAKPENVYESLADQINRRNSALQQAQAQSHSNSHTHPSVIGVQSSSMSPSPPPPPHSQLTYAYSLNQSPPQYHPNIGSMATQRAAATASALDSTSPGASKAPPSAIMSEMDNPGFQYEELHEKMQKEKLAESRNTAETPF